MTRMRSSHGAWRVMGTILMMFASVFAVGSATAASAMPRTMFLPFPAGQIWWVCQGYNGQVSHQNVAALDLSVAPDAAGSIGCTPATANASTGRSVIAPGSGHAYHVNSDMVCINFDAGGSALVGHIGNRVAGGTHVTGGSTVLGQVNPPDSANRGYAHIHIQAYLTSGCGTAPKAPFDTAHGARFECNQDLPYSGQQDQYSGINLVNCGSTARTAPPLGGINIWNYCVHLGYSGEKVVTANAYGYRCTDSGGSTHTFSMDGACQWQYPGKSALSRFWNFYSTTTWQCFGSAGILGSINYPAYCQAQGASGWTTLQNNAYGVACWNGTGDTWGINTDKACQWEYRRGNAAARVINFNSTTGWQCFLTRS